MNSIYYQLMFVSTIYEKLSRREIGAVAFLKKSLGLDQLASNCKCLEQTTTLGVYFDCLKRPY